MNQFIIYLGFIITAYAVITNDVIQTLGTFLASNDKKMVAAMDVYRQYSNSDAFVRMTY
ncbi:hypothetical protein [Patiriisocius sp. Uisw_017]|uniref:hypothetical protein n=1 Tax=Patiriisocius sp. Uisw_017 TaxID=3230968 RepID=UPI0039EB0A64